jgi:hypothetical protein
MAPSEINGDDLMDRRELLRNIWAGVPAATAIIAGGAAKSAYHVREASEQSLEACRQRIEELRTRFDQSELSTKKALKVVFALTALSLGVDVSTLL